MSNFHPLSKALAEIAAAKPAGIAVKGLALGESVMAGVLQCGRHVLEMHRQPDHEELLVVLEGEGTFRVGDEVRAIRTGDLVFIPRGAVHGAMAVEQAPLALLSIMTPRIDIARDVVWEQNRPAIEMVR